MNKKKFSKLKGLYAITDERLTPFDTLLENVKEALLGGARIVQLRDKTHSDEELFPISVRLKELCQGHDALFIINDRAMLAKRVGANGIHIGKDDIDFQEARDILGEDFIIGVSCYNDLERALYFQDLGADYVAFGSFFSSPTKPEAVKAEIELLERAKEELSIPVCAIGGITSENAHLVIDAGADMVAIISDLWKSKDVKQRAMSIAMLFK